MFYPLFDKVTIKDKNDRYYTPEQLIDRIIEEYEEYEEQGLDEIDELIESVDIIVHCVRLMKRLSKENKIHINTLLEIAYLKWSSREKNGKNKETEKKIITEYLKTIKDLKDL